MRREEDQELWDLLGNLKKTPVSAFFARNVLRQIRQQPSSFDQLRNWFTLRRLIPASALAIGIIAAIILAQHPRSRPPVTENLPEAVAKIDPQDYEVVADLDVLLASDENSLWDEDPSL